MPADRRFELNVASGIGGVLVVVAAAAVVAGVGLLLALVMTAIFSGGT